MKYLFFFMLLFPCIIKAQQTTVSLIQDEFYHQPQHVLVTAHRASHLHFPENSLPAIDASIHAGIDIVELDIHETKDSVLVVIHDATINRTTTGKGKVKDFTYQQLQQFFLLQDGKPTGLHIPRFEDVLKLAKDRILIDIDFKEDGARAAKNTYRLLQLYHMEKQVLFFIYNYKDLPRFRQLSAEVPVMPRAYANADVEQILHMEGCPVVHVDESYYSDSVMEKIRSSGRRVWLNALDKFDDMEQHQPGSGFSALLQQYKQVNIIQTNYPEQLLAYLRRRGLHR